jgi:hypothetical protein
MVGIAVPTIMLSSIASSIAIMRPTMTTRTLRWRGSLVMAGGVAVWDMTGPPP